MKSCHQRVCIRYIWLLVLLLAMKPAAMQAQLNPDRLVQYGEKDGLPGSEVYAVMPDRNGYIWTGTMNGLSRFDGYEFKRYYYNPNDTTSIKGSIIWSLLEDVDHHIWVGGVSALNRYDPATGIFHHYEYRHLTGQPEGAETGIVCMDSDPTGNIYFGVRTNRGDGVKNGLLYYNKKADQLSRVASPDTIPIGEVWSIKHDKAGNFWVISINGILRVDPAGNVSRFHQLDPEMKQQRANASGLFADTDGNLWVGLSSGMLYQVNLATGGKKEADMAKAFSLDRSRNIEFNAMVSGPDKSIWIATAIGLVTFNPQTGKFSGFPVGTEKKLDRTLLWNIAFDPFGSVWMGSSSKGLLKYDNNTLLKSYSSSKDNPNSITIGWANNIRESASGKIAFSTGGQFSAGGFNELDPETGQVLSISIQEIAPRIWGINTLYETAPGEYIINTFNKTYRFWPATNRKELIELPGLLPNSIVNHFFTDSKGTLWLGASSGLYRQEKNSRNFERYDLSKLPGCNLTSNEVIGITESLLNGLWLRTNAGLFFYSYATDKVERHGYDQTKGDVFFSQDVNAIYEDDDSTLWVGTWQGGLGKYNTRTHKIRNYTTNDGLPGMSIQSILEDEPNNMLWMGSFDGLIRFNKQTNQFNSFSIADGIQSQLFADGAALKTSKGYFVFGGSNGITIFKPGDIARNSIPPKVFLTDLRLFNKPVVPVAGGILEKPINETQAITLGYAQNNITIDFLAIHYGNPARNKYVYRLQNFENDWRDVGGQHTAYFSKLPPGKYLFQVRAANNNGVWNETGASLSITILPPWWRTPAAYVGYVFAFIGLLFAGDRYFRHRLLSKERERNQARELEQAREIEKAYLKLSESHESLKATQKQLIQSEKMASLGELTAGIAHEIQNPLNFVNNFAEVNNELIAEMKEELRAGKQDAALDIARSIETNNSRINEHGKRADGIVKSMLQHSRTSKGVREATDINQLCEEYLRLSYHGYRAKDHGFNVTMVTEFAPSLPPVPVIPQEIGRVLLNLFNNAFYAVKDRKNEATVTVRTFSREGFVCISIRDNGTGIPEEVRDKVFQPFFTTKPTGQGTGLGLSLSYDIIQSHGGKLSMQSKEGEGTGFTIELPV